MRPIFRDLHKLWLLNLRCRRGRRFHDRCRGITICHGIRGGPKGVHQVVRHKYRRCLGRAPQHPPAPGRWACAKRRGDPGEEVRLRRAHAPPAQAHPGILRALLLGRRRPSAFIVHALAATDTLRLAFQGRLGGARACEASLGRGSPRHFLRRRGRDCNRQPRGADTAACASVVVRFLPGLRLACLRLPGRRLPGSDTRHRSLLWRWSGRDATCCKRQLHGAHAAASALAVVRFLDLRLACLHRRGHRLPKNTSCHRFLLKRWSGPNNDRLRLRGPRGAIGFSFCGGVLNNTILHATCR
mmetsp:Transcript_119135/g.344614  ORF Transcript_119135/g.344614 Transcript_119135/m.344614 type:complete len:299 (-) Transcript_119135:124-1020(-)